MSYLSTQGVVQILSFMAGIMIVRTLPKDDYAYYALAVGVIAAVSLVSEAGTNAALMSIGSKRIGSEKELSELFTEARRFRLIIGSVIVLAGTSLLCFMLWANGAPAWTIAGMSLLVIISFWPIFTNAVLQTYHRLMLHRVKLQHAALLASGTRVALILSIALMATAGVLKPEPSVFLIVNLLGLLVSLAFFWRAAPGSLLRGNANPDLRPEFRSVARRVLPLAALIVVGEQFYFLTLSVHGGVDVVADASALSRFAVAFVVANALVADLAAPRIARMNGSAYRIARGILSALGIYLLFSIALVSAAAIAAPALLWLLGSQYAGQEMELVLFAAGYAAVYLGYAWDALNQARGWVRGSSAYVALISGWALWAWFFADVSSTSGAAVAFCLLSVPMLLTQCIRTIVGVRTS